MTKREKAAVTSRVYLEAAKIQFLRRWHMTGCCHAIKKARHKLGLFYEPHYASAEHLLFEEYFDWTTGVSTWETPPNDREPRILALLLMSEIAKDEERTKSRGRR